MAIKVENQASVLAPVKNLDEQIQRALECVPVEHLRGLGRVVLVDRIEDPRLDPSLTANLPVLYRPRMPGQASAAGEIALAIVFPPDANWFKKLVTRGQARALVAQLALSIAAQHYLVTLSSRKKKGGGIERAAREYVEKYFAVWRERQGGLRAKLFKPLIPYLERWQKSARKYQAEQARKKAAN
jgi:hypothetical protein